MESPSIPANYSFRRDVLRTEMTGDGNGTGDLELAEVSRTSFQTIASMSCPDVDRTAHKLSALWNLWDALDAED